MDNVENQRKTDAQDENTLAEFGYRQELKRDWGLLQNFGVSFSIISISTGITTLFYYGLTTGGPGVMATSWLIVSFFTFFVALAMAEVTSSIPTSGGPYYWAAMIAPKHLSPFFAYFTGWMNFVGQFAVTTGISFGLAGLISTAATVKNDYTPSAGKTIAIYLAILISHVLINCFGVRTLKYFNNASILIHSVGIGALAIALVAKAPHHPSASDIWSFFYDGTGVDGAEGWSERASPAYVAIIGILLTQYTITGFDGSAHTAEETHDAARAAPLGVIMSVGVSFLFGWFFLLCLLFSMQDFDRTVSSKYGQPVLQILVDVFGESGALVGFTLIMLCVWHAGLFSLTSNSRMMYAFARDRGLPGFFDYVHPTLKVPIYTILLAAFLAFLLALPSLRSTVAFAAATSIATIGLYISYTTPTLLILIWPNNFTPGPFNLGALSVPIRIVACLWTVFITVVFCLPGQNPVNSQTLNYTPVAVGIVFILIFGSWPFAKRHFTGPRRQVEVEGFAHVNAKLNPETKKVAVD